VNLIPPALLLLIAPPLRFVELILPVPLLTIALQRLPSPAVTLGWAGLVMIRRRRKFFFFLINAI
jgi:hypothetical protein